MRFVRFILNNKNKPIKLLLIFLALSSIISCAPLQYISSFQKLTLPEKPLPYQQSKIALASRVFSENDLNYSPYDSTSLSYKYLSNKAVLALKENLESAPGFENLVFPTFNYVSLNDSTNILPLDSLGILALKESTDADYVIALDYIRTSSRQVEKTPMTDEYDRKFYYSASIAPILEYWRIYDMNKLKCIDECLVADTLIWDTYAYDRFSPSLNNIPSLDEAKILAAISGAKGYLQHIAPYWANAARIYFSDGTADMEMAAIYVEQSRWNDAIKIWLNEVKSTNKKRAGIAAFNMAVGTETLDDIELSKEWLNEAKGKYKSLQSVISFYEKVLDQRIQEQQKLDSLFMPKQ